MNQAVVVLTGWSCLNGVMCERGVSCERGGHM